MADDRAYLVLVLLEKLSGRGERYLVDIPVDLLGSHSYAAVGYPEHLLLLVEIDAHLKFPEFPLEVAAHRESLHLLGRVHRIGDELAQENLMV